MTTFLSTRLAFPQVKGVEVAGIEPASADGKPGLLRVQCAVDFLGPSARTHTSTDRPSRVRVPGNPHDKGAQQAF
jgi:hypothetical protein